MFLITSIKPGKFETRLKEIHNGYFVVWYQGWLLYVTWRRITFSIHFGYLINNLSNAFNLDNKPKNRLYFDLKTIRDKNKHQQTTTKIFWTSFVVINSSKDKIFKVFILIFPQIIEKYDFLTRVSDPSHFDWWIRIFWIRIHLKIH